MKQIECWEGVASDGERDTQLGYFTKKELAERASRESGLYYQKPQATIITVFESWPEYRKIRSPEAVKEALDKLSAEEIELLGLKKMASDIYT